MTSELHEYVTSDLHFFHTNIIKYADRTNYQPATEESTLQMNQDIVKYINQQIPDNPNVVLWNLGDVFYGRLFSKASLYDLHHLVSVMKGQYRTLKLILGNHDKQFKRFAKWENLSPLNEKSSLKEIFEYLGFDYVYDYPVVYKEHFLLSHEPIFLHIKKASQFINIHGHTHQKNVLSTYFAWEIENRDMVLKAYQDSHRDIPPNANQLKPDHVGLLVDNRNYINVCWDSTHTPKVYDLTYITQDKTT